jgi:hypothetical protein
MWEVLFFIWISITILVRLLDLYGTGMVDIIGGLMVNFAVIGVEMVFGFVLIIFSITVLQVIFR